MFIFLDLDAVISSDEGTSESESRSRAHRLLSKKRPKMSLTAKSAGAVAVAKVIPGAGAAGPSHVDPNSQPSTSAKPTQASDGSTLAKRTVQSTFGKDLSLNVPSTSAASSSSALGVRSKGSGKVRYFVSKENRRLVCLGNPWKIEGWADQCDFLLLRWV